MVNMTSVLHIVSLPLSVGLSVCLTVCVPVSLVVGIHENVLFLIQDGIGCLGVQHARRCHGRRIYVYIYLRCNAYPTYV